MNNSIQQNIFDTIKIVVEDYLKKADFDKTIIAYIKTCKNDNLGLYSISYNGAIYEAYGTPGIKYADGTQVYVLKPANDSTNNMFIIGSTTGTQVIIEGANKDSYTKAEIDKFIENLNEGIQNNTLNIDDLYLKLSDTNDLLNILNNTKQDKLIAGNNITIEDNIISASGGGDTYSAGQGIDISAENEISTAEPPPIDITFEDYKNLTEEERLANTYYVTDVNIPFEDKFTEIDDNRVSAESTWSSEKINNLFTKINVAPINEYDSTRTSIASYQFLDKIIVKGKINIKTDGNTGWMTFLQFPFNVKNINFISLIAGRPDATGNAVYSADTTCYDNIYRVFIPRSDLNNYYLIVDCILELKN